MGNIQSVSLDGKFGNLSVQKNIQSLNATDEKINLKVVGGGVLIALSLAGLAATITCSVIFTPIGLCGLAGVAVAAVAGTYFCWTGSTETEKPVEKPQEKPVENVKKRRHRHHRHRHRHHRSDRGTRVGGFDVRGLDFGGGAPLAPLHRAVGLANRSASDCWLNSSLQMLLNAPSLVQRIEGACPAIRQLALDYTERQEAGRSCLHRGPTQVRRELSQAYPQISEDRQEDAAEVFELLFTGDASPHQLVRANAAYPNPGLIGLPFAGTHEANPTFDRLLGGYCQENQFVSAPDDLMIQVQRFYHAYDAHGVGRPAVTHREFDVPAQFVLPDDASQDQDVGPYECRGFNVHTGTLNCGHYTAYVKKGDQWWHCDDDRVSRVSQERALQAMSRGYLFHYQKVQVQPQAE